nr:hypothetical protein [Tanacetum cinerariifolium]
MAQPPSPDYAADILEEDPKEESEKEPEEQELKEMEMDDEMDDAELIFLYDAPGSPCPPASKSEYEPKDETATTVGTITQLPSTGRRFPSSIHVRGGSSSTAPVAYDLEDLVSSYMRKDIDSLDGVVEHQNNKTENVLVTLDDRVPKLEQYGEMIQVGAVREERPSKAVDVLATFGETPPSEPRGSPRDSQSMPPRRTSNAAIEQLINERVAKALADDKVVRENARGPTGGARGPTGGAGGPAGGAGGPAAAPAVQECAFASFMKCNPTFFHGTKGVVELCRWFKNMEMVFSTEGKNVKFAAATSQGRALTWWNSQVANLALETAKGFHGHN